MRGQQSSPGREAEEPPKPGSAPCGCCQTQRCQGILIVLGVIFILTGFVGVAVSVSLVQAMSSSTFGIPSSVIVIFAGLVCILCSYASKARAYGDEQGSRPAGGSRQMTLPSAAGALSFDRHHLRSRIQQETHTAAARIRMAVRQNIRTLLQTHRGQRQAGGGNGARQNQFADGARQREANFLTASSVAAAAVEQGRDRSAPRLDQSGRPAPNLDLHHGLVDERPVDYEAPSYAAVVLIPGDLQPNVAGQPSAGQASDLRQSMELHHGGVAVAPSYEEALLHSVPAYAATSVDAQTHDAVAGPSVPTLPPPRYESIVSAVGGRPNAV